MEIVFTKQAKKDFLKIRSTKLLYDKVVALLDLINDNPFQTPPSYEKLIGFNNVYSRRINIQHRLIYEFDEKQQIIKIIRM